MKTNIYKTYQDFINRENKKDNGVSEEFAVAHLDYEEDNETNKGCWNCSRCSDCSGCSGCSRCSDCSDCSDCSRCSYCSGCSDCSRCSDCSGCSRCSGCSDKKGDLVFPVIENIHQKVLEALPEYNHSQLYILINALENLLIPQEEVEHEFIRDNLLERFRKLIIK